MKHIVTCLCCAFVLLVTFTGSTAWAQATPGIEKRLADHPVRPTQGIWAPVADLFSDDFRFEVKAEIINAAMRAYNATLNRIVRLRTDDDNNLKVVVSGSSATTISGPLGTRAAAESVSTAPPTDARYQVSKDANSNASTNPIFTQLTDGADLSNIVTDAATQAAGLNGLVTLDLLQFFDGSDWRRVTGAALDSDDIASTTVVPYVGNFNYLYDTVNDNWDRMSGYDIKLSFKDVFALFTYSATMFMVGDTFYDWRGAAMNDDAVLNTVTAPWVGSFNMMHDTVGDSWERFHAHAAGDALSATQMGLDVLGYTLFYDGTDYRRWQGITAANGLTLPVAPWTNTVIYGYNGATLDMAKLGAVGELLVTDVATRPGEDAGNDWRKTKKEAIAVYTPAPTTGTAVAAAAVEVLGSKEIMGYPNVCIWLKNAGGGGGGPLTDADIQVSPDGTLWVSITSTVCDAITSGIGCVQCLEGSAYRYVRVYATAAAPANDTTVDAWLTANVN